jgi:hypothetical protein
MWVGFRNRGIEENVPIYGTATAIGIQTEHRYDVSTAWKVT